ncbi:MAG: hypothetical protein HZC17_05940, partial [Candidatus Omnitrophica bacterium]|nr:hypothetical protein [Candidatus Omnitrophota bacterium]
MLKKPVAYITIITFLFSQGTVLPYGFAQPTLPGNKAEIVIVEGAHGYQSARESVRNILSELETKVGFRNFFVEGAAQPLQSLIIESFPDVAAREAYLKRQFDQGMLNGAEMAALHRQAGTEFLGLENPLFYNQNLKAYFDVKKSPDVKKAFDAAANLGNEISAKKKELFPKELLELESHEQMYQKSKNISDWLDYLKRFNGTKPEGELKTLWDWQAAQESVKKQFPAVIQSLEKKINSFELTKEKQVQWGGLRQSRMTGCLDERAYIAGMKELLGSDNLSREETTLDVSLPALSVHMLSDLETFVDGLKDRMAVTESAKDLLRQSRKLSLEKSALNLELTRSQYQEIENEHIQIPAEIKNYYELAIKREKAFVGKINEAIRTGKTRQVVHVGGFHTKGLTDELSRNQVTVRVIQPKFELSQKSPSYESRMKAFYATIATLKEPSELGIAVLRDQTESGFIAAVEGKTDPTGWAYSLIHRATQNRPVSREDLLALVLEIANWKKIGEMKQAIEEFRKNEVVEKPVAQVPARPSVAQAKSMGGEKKTIFEKISDGLWKIQYKAVNLLADFTKFYRTWRFWLSIYLGAFQSYLKLIWAIKFNNIIPWTRLYIALWEKPTEDDWIQKNKEEVSLHLLSPVLFFVIQQIKNGKSNPEILNVDPGKFFIRSDFKVSFYLLAGIDPVMNKTDLEQVVERIARAFQKVQKIPERFQMIVPIYYLMKIGPESDRFYIRRHKTPEILGVLETLGQIRNDGSVVDVQDVSAKLVQMTKNWKGESEREDASALNPFPAKGSEEDWLARIAPEAPVTGASLGMKKRYEASELSRELGMNWKNFKTQYPKLARILVLEPVAYSALETLMRFGDEPVRERFAKWSSLLVHISEKAGREYFTYMQLNKLIQSAQLGEVDESLIDKDFLWFITEKVEDNSDHAYDGLRGLGSLVKSGKADASLADKEFLKFIAEKSGRKTGAAFVRLQGLGSLVKSGKVDASLIDKEFLKLIASKSEKDTEDAYYLLMLFAEVVNKAKGKFKISEVIHEYETLGQTRNDGSVVSWKDVHVKLNQLKKDWTAELERKKSAPPETPGTPEPDWLARITPEAPVTGASLGFRNVYEQAGLEKKLDGLTYEGFIQQYPNLVHIFNTHQSAYADFEILAKLKGKKVLESRLFEVLSKARGENRPQIFRVFWNFLNATHDPRIVDLSLLEGIAKAEARDAGEAFSSLKRLKEAVEEGQVDAQILNHEFLLRIARESGVHTVSAYLLLLGLDWKKLEEERTLDQSKIVEVIKKMSVVHRLSGRTVFSLINDLYLLGNESGKSILISEHRTPEILGVLETLGQRRNDGSVVMFEDVAAKLKHMKEDWKREVARRMEKPAPPAEQDWLARERAAGASLGIQDEVYEEANRYFNETGRNDMFPKRFYYMRLFKEMKTLISEVQKGDIHPSVFGLHLAEITREGDGLLEFILVLGIKPGMNEKETRDELERIRRAAAKLPEPFVGNFNGHYRNETIFFEDEEENRVWQNLAQQVANLLKLRLNLESRARFFVEKHRSSEILDILETLGQPRNDGSVVNAQDLIEKFKQLEKDWKAEIDREKAVLPEEPGPDWLARVPVILSEAKDLHLENEKQILRTSSGAQNDKKVTGASLGAKERYEEAKLTEKFGKWTDFAKKNPKLKTAMEANQDIADCFFVLVKHFNLTPSDLEPVQILLADPSRAPPVLKALKEFVESPIVNTNFKNLAFIHQIIKLSGAEFPEVLAAFTSLKRYPQISESVEKILIQYAKSELKSGFEADFKKTGDIPVSKINNLYAIQALLHRVLNPKEITDKEARRLFEEMKIAVDIRWHFSMATVNRVSDEFCQFLRKYVIGGKLELLEVLIDIPQNQPVYKILDQWVADAQQKYGKPDNILAMRDALRVLMLTQKIENVKDAMSEFDRFIADILKPEYSKYLDEGGMEAFRALSYIYFYSGSENLKYILTKGIDQLKKNLGFPDGSETQILIALGDIAKSVYGTGTALPDMFKLLAKNYKEFINKDLDRFRSLGEILGYAGVNDFKRLEEPLRKIMEYMGIKQEDKAFSTLLALVAKIARTGRDGTSALLDEAIELYKPFIAKGNLDDLNKVLNVFRYFSQIANFHKEYEAMVLSGEIGKENNETLFVSLRDMKKTLAIIERDYKKGMPIEDAVSNAVR